MFGNPNVITSIILDLNFTKVSITFLSFLWSHDKLTNVLCNLSDLDW